MKNFFKKVAFVLALAMVLSNIGPAAKASAAETPGLKYSTRVLYVGGSAWDEYTDSCWTPSQNHDGYTVSYEWNSSIIDVASNGRITATGNGIGKAVVTVIYTPMGSGKVETAKFTVKVRRNATDVRLTNTTITLIEEALSVGTEIELNAAKSFFGNSYKTGNYGLNNYMKVVSDQIAYDTSNDEVIKVEDNKLTAVGSGTAKLTVKAYEYGDETQTPVVSMSYDITVIGGLVSIVQKDFKTFEITFAQELEEAPDASEFTITKDDDTKQNIAINTVKLSDDKKIVTLTTFLELNDGADYILTYDEKEYTFTTTDAEPFKISINKTEIEYDNETEIVFSVYDKNDVKLKEAKIGSPDAKLDFTFDDMDYGYVNGDNLVIWEKGKSVKITATYHSGVFDEKDGLEKGNINGTFIIIATDQKPVLASDLKCTITDKGDEAPDWSKTANREIYVNESGRYIHIYLENSKKEDVTQIDDFTIESADENVLMVGGVYSNGGKGICAPISAVSKTGIVNVIVKKDGKVFATIPITINREKVFTNFDVSFDKNTVSNSEHLSVNDKAVITVTFKDQYTNKIAVIDGVEISSLTRPSGVEPNDALALLSSGDSGETQELTFSASGATSGTYTYRLTYKNVSRTVSIIVQNASQVGTPTYRVVLSETNVDISYNKDNKGKKEIVVRIAKLVNNVVVSYENISDYTLTVSKGSNNEALVVTKGADNTKGSITLRTIDTASVSGSVLATVSGSVVVKKEATGTYQITAIDGDDKVLPKITFVVNDTQKSLVGNQVSPTVNATSYTDAVKAAFNFKYDGGDASEDIDKFVIDSINTANVEVITGSALNALAKGNVIYVKDITVFYKIPDTDANVYYEYKVTLNRTITIK